MIQLKEKLLNGAHEIGTMYSECWNQIKSIIKYFFYCSLWNNRIDLVMVIFKMHVQLIMGD